MPVEAPVGRVVAYRLDQRFRYRYESSVRNVRQRLVVAPRAVHGGQRRLSFTLEVDGASANSSIAQDGFGNDVVTATLETVDSAAEFTVSADVDLRDTSGRSTVRPEMLRDARFLSPTELSRPDRQMARIGSDLARRASGERLAESICSWTHSALEYGYGATTVRTTAAQALSVGRGVCQDLAHVMIAVCRSAALPARYVSGHLVGEGGSHAWVEVLLEDGKGTSAIAFDPTHDRRTDSRYLTVAIGRDYVDVAPTSGTFEGACSSILTSSKRLVVRNDEPATALVSP